AVAVSGRADREGQVLAFREPARAPQLHQPRRALLAFPYAGPRVRDRAGALDARLAPRERAVASAGGQGEKQDRERCGETRRRRARTWTAVHARMIRPQRTTRKRRECMRVATALAATRPCLAAPRAGSARPGARSSPSCRT